MPRGVRGSVDYSAQIQTLNEKIEKHKRSIAVLTAQRQELQAKKEEADMHELYRFMQNNSMSASEVIARLAPAASIVTDATEL